MALVVPVHDGMSVGRLRTCDLSLPDTKVSRRHAQLRAHDQALAIVDLGSTHGVTVNGTAAHQHTLRDGDRIQIGETLLTYVDEPDGTSATRFTAQTLAHAESSHAAPLAIERRLLALTKAAARIGAEADDESVARALIASAIEGLGRGRGVVGRFDAQGGHARQVAVAGAHADRIAISREVIDAVEADQAAVLVSGASERPETMVRRRVGSAIAAPILVAGRVFGIAYVEHDDSGAFDDSDLAFLTALAYLSGAVIDAGERAIPPQGTGAASMGIAGNSPAITRLRAEVDRVAHARDTHVVIRGESGTGKELVARALHEHSPRAGAGFVAINCAAVPDTMLESELFGHVRGAFTGAVRDKRGRFQLADQGTLFLDEVAELSAAAQAKLLRAIEEGEVQRVGSEALEWVDVRVISASHKNLRDEVAGGRFREDLYYRLAVVEITVPSLRERTDDIPLLAQQFLVELASRAGSRVTGFTPDALKALRQYVFPGNVRELRNEVERAVILAEGPAITLSDLSERVCSEPKISVAAAEPGEQSLAARYASLEPTERGLVAEALTATDGNLAEAARLLGISWIMMKRRVARYGLSDSSE